MTDQVPSDETPVGLEEISELLAVPIEKVVGWQRRNLLPPSDFSVHAMPSWKARTIIEWAQRTGATAVRTGNDTPVGGQEIAQLLHVKPTTVQQWKFRGLLPPADFVVNGMDAWSTATILDWAHETGRLGRTAHVASRGGEEDGPERSGDAHGA